MIKKILFGALASLCISFSCAQISFDEETYDLKEFRIQEVGLGGNSFGFCEDEQYYVYIVVQKDTQTSVNIIYGDDSSSTVINEDVDGITKNDGFTVCINTDFQKVAVSSGTDFTEGNLLSEEVDTTGIAQNKAKGVKKYKCGTNAAVDITSNFGDTDNFEVSCSASNDAIKFEHELFATSNLKVVEITGANSLLKCEANQFVTKFALFSESNSDSLGNVDFYADSTKKLETSNIVSTFPSSDEAYPFYITKCLNPFNKFELKLKENQGEEHVLQKSTIASNTHNQKWDTTTYKWITSDDFSSDTEVQISEIAFEGSNTGVCSGKAYLKIQNNEDVDVTMNDNYEILFTDISIPFPLATTVPTDGEIFVCLSESYIGFPDKFLKGDNIKFMKGAERIQEFDVTTGNLNVDTRIKIDTDGSTSEEQISKECDEAEFFKKDTNECISCPSGQYQSQKNHQEESCINQKTCGANEEFDDNDQKEDASCKKCKADEYLTATDHQNKKCFKKRGWHELCTKDVECDKVGSEKTECKLEPGESTVTTCQKVSSSSDKLAVSLIVTLGLIFFVSS